MASLLAKVKTKLFIVARRRSWGLLDGEYASVFRGRSLDYDDLREYVPGDEIRDIDWKATARHGSPLVKRYVATRKQTVLLVVDTGSSMAAVAPSGEPKKDLAVLVAGMLGYLALRHSDPVGLVAGDSAGSRMYEAKSSEAHLEVLLRAVDVACHAQAAPSRFVDQLQYVADHVRARTLLLVVADDHALSTSESQATGLATGLLRRLHAQHEILWVTVADADPTRFESYRDAAEVRDQGLLPAAVRSRARVHAAYQAATIERQAALDGALGDLAISRTRIAGSAEAANTVFRLLERQRRRGH
ncbi:MAG: DUF58 domain-containing protein [Actinomycetales bacterium]|nr:MAG: DUF58 domain-containing protein [Actinomycetales bacterium]